MSTLHHKFARVKLSVMLWNFLTIFCKVYVVEFGSFFCLVAEAIIFQLCKAPIHNSTTAPLPYKKGIPHNTTALSKRNPPQHHCLIKKESTTAPLPYQKGIPHRRNDGKNISKFLWMERN